jgi:hypothetical protein
MQYSSRSSRSSPSTPGSRTPFLHGKICRACSPDFWHYDYGLYCCCKVYPPETSDAAGIKRPEAEAVGFWSASMRLCGPYRIEGGWGQQLQSTPNTHEEGCHGWGVRPMHQNPEGSCG